MQCISHNQFINVTRQVYNNNNTLPVGRKSTRPHSNSLNRINFLMNLLKVQKFWWHFTQKKSVFVLNYHASIKNVMNIIVLIIIYYDKLKFHKSQLGDQSKIYFIQCSWLGYWYLINDLHSYCIHCRQHTLSQCRL